MNERSELSRSLRALPDSHARAKEGVFKIDSKCDPGEFSASIKNGFSGSVWFLTRRNHQHLGIACESTGPSLDMFWTCQTHLYAVQCGLLGYGMAFFLLGRWL